MTFAILIWMVVLLILSCGIDPDAWILFLATPFACVGALLLKEWLVERADRKEQERRRAGRGRRRNRRR